MSLDIRHSNIRQIQPFILICHIMNIFWVIKASDVFVVAQNVCLLKPTSRERLFRVPSIPFLVFYVKHETIKTGICQLLANGWCIGCDFFDCRYQINRMTHSGQIFSVILIKLKQLLSIKSIDMVCTLMIE